VCDESGAVGRRKTNSVEDRQEDDRLLPRESETYVLHVTFALCGYFGDTRDAHGWDVDNCVALQCGKRGCRCDVD
jgi:hypothetical protein